MGSLSLPHYSYLRFLIERGVAPAPAIIRVVAHSEEWANRQDMEELRSTWPAANSALLEVGTFLSCDLLVVTFDGDLPVNPCAFEQKYPAPWVIFYGLEMRRISVFQAGKAN
jgi:hypothetical protein